MARREPLLSFTLGAGAFVAVTELQRGHYWQSIQAALVAAVLTIVIALTVRLLRKI